MKELPDWYRIWFDTGHVHSSVLHYGTKEECLQSVNQPVYKIEKERFNKMKKWLGVDFDGTLSKYEGWKGPDKLGEPIEPIVKAIKEFMSHNTDIEVRIFTARSYPITTVSRGDVDLETASRLGEDYYHAAISINAVRKWTEQVFGVPFPVTCVKDYWMIQLWDDRAVGVVHNEGIFLS